MTFTTLVKSNTSCKPVLRLTRLWEIADLTRRATPPCTMYVDSIIPRTKVPWHNLYQFFNRLRALWQDMVIQKITGNAAIWILEHSIRFLVYASYKLDRTDFTDLFSAWLETYEWVSEQFLNGVSAHNRPFQCHYMVLRLKPKYT